MIWEFLDNHIWITSLLLAIFIILVAFSICSAIENNLEVKGCGEYNSFDECYCSRDCIELGFNVGVYEYGSVFKSDECWCRGAKEAVQIS